MEHIVKKNGLTWVYFPSQYTANTFVLARKSIARVTHDGLRVYRDLVFLEKSGLWDHGYDPMKFYSKVEAMMAIKRYS